MSHRLSWPGVALVLALSACRSGAGGITGVGGPSPSLSPSAADFGSTPVGQPALVRFALANQGGGPFVLDGLGDLTASGDYQVELVESPPGAGGGDAGWTVEPASAGGTPVTFVVAFQPTATGARPGLLTVKVRDPASTGASSQLRATAVLTGAGLADDTVQLEVSPDSLSFPATQSLRAVSKSLQVKNPNAFPVQVYLTAPASPAGEPDTSGDFTAPRFGPALQPGQSGTVAIGFTPAGSESAHAITQVSACPACPATAVDLSGYGTDATLALEPRSLDFGFVLNNPSPRPQLTVTATLTGSVGVTVPAFAANPGSPFRVISTSPATPLLLSADAGLSQFSLTVGYEPSGVLGGDSDQLAIGYSLATGGEKTAYLPMLGNRSVLPCQLAALPVGQVDFGYTAPGEEATQNLRLVNIGSADCAGLDLAVLPPADPAFAVGDAGVFPPAGPGTLPAHGSIDLALSFLPPSVASSTLHRSQLQVTVRGTAVLEVELVGRSSSPYDPASPWPKVGHDNGNSGQGQLIDPAFDGGLLWRVDLAPPFELTNGSCAGFGYAGSGLVLDGHDQVIQLGCDGQLHAFDAQSGALNHLLALPGPVAAQHIGPTIGSGGVLTLGYQSAGIFPYVKGTPTYYPSAIYTIQLPQLTLLGEVPAPSVTAAAGPAPVVGGAALLFGGPALFALGPSGSGDLGQVISADPGAIGLQFDFGAHGAAHLSALATSGPAVGGDDSSYWCIEGDCFSLSSALSLNWHREDLALGPAIGVRGSPLLTDRALYFFDFYVPTLYPVAGAPPYHAIEGRLYALDRAGQILWSDDLPPVPFPHGPNAGRDPLNGLLGLLQQTQHLDVGPVLGPGGSILLPYADGVYAYSATQPGPPLWRAPIAGGASGTPVVDVGGTVFVPTLTAGVVALDAESGARRGAFAPTIGPDGGTVAFTSPLAIGPYAVYAVGSDGALYAFH